MQKGESYERNVSQNISLGYVLPNMHTLVGVKLQNGGNLIDMEAAISF